MTLQLEQQAQVAGGGAPTLRAAFVMEQDVGHAVQAMHTRRELDRHGEVEARLIPVTFFKQDGALERLPLPHYVRASLRARAEVLEGLAGFRPEAIVWNTQKPALFCPGLLRRVPSVISLDVTPLQYDDFGPAYGHDADRLAPLRALKHAVNRGVFRAAERLLPATHWVASSLIRDYDADPERIEVVPPGTDLQRFRPSAAKPSERDGIVRLLFVGGEFVRKGGDLLVEWLESAPEARRCEVDIVTREAIRERPRLRVHSANHDSGLLTRLYAEADVFVLPTRAECFGLVLTEAMAAGLPVVTCDVGGIAEVVEDGVTAFVTRPEDAAGLATALSRLVGDAELRRRLGRAGRARAEARFDAAKNVARVLEILREAAAAS